MSDRRWWALAALVSCQLMLMLDVTIVNIALPAAQHDLGISDAGRQWVVTAYAITFGGLLLLGGRIADRVGRRRTLIVALVGFAAASALGGAAWSPGTLFAARALQGAFGALLAPAVLSSISLLFPEGDGRARARAFGVYAAVSAAGGAVGYLVGGALTDVASWRWCLIVNAPIAIVTATAVAALLPESRTRAAGGLDIPGALLATAASSVLVFGVARAAEEGWGSPATIGSLSAALVLAAAFLVIESRARHPLLPLEILRHRVRAGVFVATLFSFGANTGLLLLVVIYLQGTLGMSAIEAGLSFMPFMAAAVVGSMLAAQVVERVGPRALMAGGAGCAATGIVLLTGLGAESSYLSDILPGFVLDGFGVGLLFVPATSLSLHDVAERDTGAASGSFTTVQQVGIALGAALVNTAAVSAASGALADGSAGTPAQALLHGQSVGIGVAAALMALAGIGALALVGRARASAPIPGAHAVL